MKIIKIYLIIIVFIVSACNQENSEATDTIAESNSTFTGDLPAGFNNFSEDVDISVEGDYVIVKTKNIPNHPSPYFGSSSLNYEAPHSGMLVNPNRIEEQNLVFRIPLNPTENSSATETDLGPIGISTSGVVFYNQYAGRTFSGWLPLDNEIVTFDKYNGHPQQQGQYHYHFEPIYLTESNLSGLIGFALDGFPIYGPLNPDGTKPNLDNLNGEFAATPEFPEGIYHYHVTSFEPYIIGGFKGSPGTFTN